MRRRPVFTTLSGLLVLLIILGQQAPGSFASADPSLTGQAVNQQRVFLPFLQQPYSFTTRTPKPVTVSPRLDNARSVSMSVPTSGGVLTATAADGTRFTLTLPRDALLTQTQITMTPLSGMFGLPFGGGFVAGVDLKPSGLRLVQPATLQIEPATAVPATEEIAFGYRNMREFSTSGELYLYPLQLGTPSIIFKLLHFSGYGIGKGTQADRAAQEQRAPTTYEDQLQQQVEQLIAQERQAVLAGQPGDPQFMNKIASLMQQFYNKIVQPILGPAQRDCGFAERYYYNAISWSRQIQLLGLSEDPYDGSFDVEEQAIQAAGIASYYNCLEQATRPCINRKWPAQMSRILGYIRLLQLMGEPTDEPRFDLDRYVECSCSQIADVQSWTGTITFSYEKEGSGDGKTITMRHSGNVTVNYAKALTSGSHIRWDDVSMNGTGQINNTYSDPPNDRRSLTGSGDVLPAGPLQDNPGASLGFFGATCSYEFYLKTAMNAELTHFNETGAVTTWLGLMDINDIPIQTTGTTLSGSRTVPALHLIEGRDVPSWFSPGSNWVSEFERILGEGNIGDVTISWSFSPTQ